MKKHLICLLFLLPAIILFSQDLSKRIENSLSEPAFVNVKGKGYLKETGDNSLLLFFNTVESKDAFDKVILISSKTSIEKLPFDETDELRLIIPGDKRYAIIYNLTKAKIHFIGLTDSKAGEMKDSYKQKSDMANQVEKYVYLGFGLSYMNGLWNMEKVKNSRFKYALNILDYSDLLQPDLASTLNVDSDEASKLYDQGQCTSGGAGSTSCSITEPLPAQGCTVTCSSGYYACCNSSSVRCYCCKVPVE